MLIHDSSSTYDAGTQKLMKQCQGGVLKHIAAVTALPQATCGAFRLLGHKCDDDTVYDASKGVTKCAGNTVVDFQTSCCKVRPIMLLFLLLLTLLATKHQDHQHITNRYAQPFC